MEESYGALTRAIHPHERKDQPTLWQCAHARNPILVRRRSQLVPPLQPQLFCLPPRCNGYLCRLNQSTSCQHGKSISPLPSKSNEYTIPLLSTERRSTSANSGADGKKRLQGSNLLFLQKEGSHQLPMLPAQWTTAHQLTLCKQQLGS